MRFIRLKSSDEPLFERAYALYQDSFPLHEQRLVRHQKLALMQEDYHFDLIMEQNALVGILLYWETEAFIYVEHFAIIPQKRGHGCGSRVLTLLCKGAKPVVLEIDPPVDKLSTRRRHFYEKAGFLSNSFHHIHPPYRSGNQGHELLVMSYPEALSMPLYQRFFSYLANTVMAFAEKDRKSERAVFTNLCMVEDANGRILVQNRLNPNWPGVTFPGGHVEPGEAFVESVIREVREETGLTVAHPRLCGIKQFQDAEDNRYCVLFFKATEFYGDLKSSEEGEVFWIEKSEIGNYALAEDFDMMLHIFEDESLSEFYYYRVNGGWQFKIL